MINLFFYLIVFLFGLITGSFLNCIIYRLAPHIQVCERIKSRSYCPKCKHILKFQDLIPLFSFIILKGKCRYCQKSISWQYPLVELMTAFLFVLIFWHVGLINNLIFDIRILDFFTLFYFLIITAFLIIIFVYDLKHYIIPDKIIYPAIVIAFFYQLFEIWNFGRQPLEESPLTGLWNLGFSILPAGFFLAIILFSRGRWMGLGDFKLAILMGLILGWPNILVALFLAFAVGAIIGIGLIIFQKKTLKSEIPFGPFLVGATFITLFWGEKIINWYLDLIKFDIIFYL